jgi:hypothetical protein
MKTITTTATTRSFLFNARIFTAFCFFFISFSAILNTSFSSISIPS